MAQKNKRLYTTIPDPTTFIGVIAGVLLLMTAIGLENGMKFFYDQSSLMIVLGGTMAATLVHFPITQLIKMFGRLKAIFFTKKAKMSAVINRVHDIAQTLKAEGKMALAKEVDLLQDPFLRHGVQLILDKVTPDQIERLLKDEIKAVEKRHYQGQVFFDTMSRYAPGFGLLGTLIGLIMMLSNLTDPETIGPNMGIALITTFYGVLLSNLVFGPLAGRLEISSAEETVVKEMMLVGIKAIAQDDAPMIVKEKMLIYISQKERKKYDRKQKKQ